MKRLPGLFAVIICFVLGFKSWAQTCCSRNANAEFASLGNDKAFISSHASPLPFTYKGEKGQQVTFRTEDGKEGMGFVVQPDMPSDSYLFVFHEWWGLNDYIKLEAEKLSKELGVNVFAVDLYDGKVTSDPDEAGKIMQSIKKERAEAIIKGAFASVGKKVDIYTIGWCFGGGWSLQAALLAGKQAQGCVMYYGMPETDIAKLKKLNCDVLGIFASKDQWINAEVVKAFEKNMKDAGKTLTVKTFEADHAFANPSNPKFDRQASGEAHELAIEFLKKRIQ